jgi:hypothetical protein
MKKISLLMLLCLIMTGGALAQQKQSFAEYWFGLKPQKLEQQLTKPIERNLPATVETLRTSTTLSNRATSPQRAMSPQRAQGMQRAASLTVTDTVTLNLNNPLNPATFTYNDKGHWTDIYTWKDYPFIEFNDDATMAFSHSNSTFEVYNALVAEYGDEEIAEMSMDIIGLTYENWNGFTIATSGDNTNHLPNWVGNDHGNMAGGGIQTDANGKVLKDADGKVLTDKNIPYLVGYVADVSWIADYMGVGPSSPVAQTLLYEPGKAVGVYINAAPWAYYSAREGDGIARALNKEGDYHKLIIHGLDENYADNGKTVEYYLAKFENGVFQQSADWEYVDLSSLGEVYGFYYTMETTDVGNYGPNTPTFFCLDKLSVERQAEAEYNYTITVPEGASVFVGSKGTKHYVPFTEVAALASTTADGKTTYYYNLTGRHNYRVSKTGALTQAGIFTPSETNTALEITAEQLSANSPKEIDRDVTSNSNYNVADIFLNINEKGYLRLASGDTYSLLNLRTWLPVDNIVSNYFVEPDYHYTVLDENGAASTDVVSIDNNGNITATGAGTAIVLVNYDAFNAPNAAGGPFFGALWAENTGVFVVSVDTPASDMTSGMLINETLNTTAESKLAGTAVDAELDVFYYLENEGGYDYTFTPANAAAVTLAQPVVGENTVSYTGFTANNVTNNGDGSYTVRLTKGRNIVKLTSPNGAADYQVLTAKTVSYTISNLTTPDAIIQPGDQVSIKFNTLYHPCAKLPGIYNMSAGIQYVGYQPNLTISPFGGAAQYTFASKAQEYKITVPADFEGEEYLLTGGVIQANGFGSAYGAHRALTRATGAGMSMSAALRTAHFGALPDIAISLTTLGVDSPAADNISVYPNPFTDYIIVNNVTEESTATIYNLSGTAMQTTTLSSGNNHLETSALPQGVYLLKAGEYVIKIVK